MTTDNKHLEELTDKELDALFTVEVAGWAQEPCNRSFWRTHHPRENDPFTGYQGDQPCHVHRSQLPSFCADTNAVMPWLSKRHWNAWTQGERDKKVVFVGIYPEKGEGVGYVPSSAPTFARAAVIALLKVARGKIR